MGPKTAMQRTVDPLTGHEEWCHVGMGILSQHTERFVAMEQAWEGRMSERKAEYYAKHLETLVEPEVQPTGLPTLLAQMVNEYHGALKLNGYSGFPDRLVEGFSQMLLACAQPLLAEYLTAITTPPKFVVREQ